jgi:hypothetical protein
MKKIIALGSLVIVMFALVSWGSLGHHVVGEIAEHHLTPQAQEAVHNLLGHETLADVSTWADEIVSDHKETAPLHYINVPSGLSFTEFEQKVESETGNNVYNAILASVKQLKDPNTSRTVKVNALKFLVHFVGDVHQPMHVSHVEDKGGNSIMVTYNGGPANLHGVWDTQIIEEDGHDYHKLAGRYDNATPVQIKKWQSDPVILWAWESYQVSTILYKEVEAPDGTTMGKDYYDAHIPIVQQRIEKAGIRLAGLLNQIFADQNIAALGHATNAAANTDGYAHVELNDVVKHIGEQVNVKGPVADSKEFDGILLINLGAPYPNSALTLVFKDSAMALGEKIKSAGSNVWVKGKLEQFKGKTEMQITSADQILSTSN